MQTWTGLLIKCIDMDAKEKIIEEFYGFVSQNEFPCVAARAAVTKNQVDCFVSNHMACPASDQQILEFLYSFVDAYRNSDQTFRSAVLIFQQPKEIKEHMFDRLLWERLNSLKRLDERLYSHDPRVDSDPSSAKYSFSLKEEAFFVVGLNPDSSRPARQFNYPALVFNPHQQFEILRQRNQYMKLQNVVRKRELAFSGSINPMLNDFGEASEVYQYSGVKHNETWVCPLMKRK